MEGAMPAAASHRKRHTSRRTHTSRAAIRDADSDRARPSLLDRIHTAEGITLQHREMGPIQLTNNFITESGELRLLIMVPEDSSGSIGVKCPTPRTGSSACQPTGLPPQAGCCASATA